MKIFNVTQIRAWDQFTIQQEPIPSHDLMERAAQVFCNWFIQQFPNSKRSVCIFCGTGNNGGDGLVIARILDKKNYPVRLFTNHQATTHSVDYQYHLKRLHRETNLEEEEWSACEKLKFSADTIIIDALFGSGLNRPLKGKYAHLIQYLNQVEAIKVAVDIPSGLFADQLSESVIFQADKTFSFQAPKLAFLISEHQSYLGELHIGDISLHSDFYDAEPSNNYYLQKLFVAGLLKSRTKFSHKGTYGHAMLIAGAYGKVGAATLAAKACLRSGVGLLTLYVPHIAYQILQISAPEAMVLTDPDKAIFTQCPDIKKYKAIGVGPGLGTAEATAIALEHLIEIAEKPIILDADALNIIGQNQDLLAKLPHHSILTPHPKEFERLFGKTNNSMDRLALLREKAQKYQIYIILKGAHTAISCPNGITYFNTTGNPGMATGGSGDVLTGIITSLLAQGYSPFQSSIIGVYLHGLAGDLAALDIAQESLLASDIIQYISNAFQYLRN